MEEEYHRQKNLDWVQDVLTDKHHDLEITQKLSARLMGYHTTKNMVYIGDIVYVINNPALSATRDHSNVDQLMKKSSR